MAKHLILFLAANPIGTSELALGREARAIQEELEQSGQRDRFEFVTRWAVRPLDLIRELRKLKPTVVHFSGHGGNAGQASAKPRRDIVAELGSDAGADDNDHLAGLFFQRPDGQPQLVTATALRATFRAAGSSVRLVVLNACYSDIHAEALRVHVDCVVGVGGSLRDDAARAFAIGFYGGLAERQSVAAAYLQGCAAINLEEPLASEVPQLRVRDGVDAHRVILVERPIPAYPDAGAEQLSKQIEDARARRDKLRDAGIAADHLDREILELRRQLREGGQLRAGDTLSDSRYLLVKVVGRGGFAVVWEAYDCTVQQRVAIKVLHSNLAGDPLRRDRFFRGARAMMHLAHPAVVRVLESRGEDGGFYYFVMEFEPGGNLREAVLTQHVEREKLLPLILQVGEALALAHDRNMVHRDVKPANILLDERGAAKLSDFDLIGAHDTTGGTRTGALGTVVYAAPECLEKPQEATARADVYGLGMTAIFCLSGRDLSMETFRNPEGTISKLGCSIQVQAVLRRAVAWEPHERFADAAAMVLELRNALSRPDRGEAALVSQAVPIRADLPALVPALTIVSHPFSHRVGERCLLDAIVSGGDVCLSRNAPDFTGPGRPLGVPLGDAFIRRKSIRFAPGTRGGVRVIVDAGGTPVVAGAPIDGHADFTAEDLAHGVALELAERVVVLLHRVDRQVEDTADPLGMVGTSTAIRRVRHQIERVADLAVPVLIRGETGTGKELVARAIHGRSSRRAGPFVSVNLAAIPCDIAAAELFGSIHGAYSGAARDRDGLFRAAHGGTLFMDGINVAPPEVHDMLLRVLTTGEIYPVGAERPVAVQVRLIAATEANLEKQIEHGQFIATLLHRLAGFEVRIPPLRERREDIGLLFYYFAREELDAIGESHRLSPRDPYGGPWLPAHVAAQLVRYAWPGNIRELRSVTRHLVSKSRDLPQLRLDPDLAVQLGVTLRRIDLPPLLSDPVIEAQRKSSDITESELQNVIRACAWDLRAAAARLEITTSLLYYMIERSLVLAAQMRAKALKAPEVETLDPFGDRRIPARAVGSHDIKVITTSIALLNKRHEQSDSRGRVACRALINMFSDLGEEEFHAMCSAIHVLKAVPRVMGGPGEPGGAWFVTNLMFDTAPEFKDWNWYAIQTRNTFTLARGDVAVRVVDALERLGRAHFAVTNVDQDGVARKGNLMHAIVDLLAEVMPLPEKGPGST